MPNRRQRRRAARSGGWLRRTRDRLVNAGAAISLPALVLGAGALLLPAAWLVLPPPNLPADTMIYDQSGHLVSVLYGTENRIPIAYRDIPPVMQNALVAIEDDTFWVQPAVDPVGIVRAALADLSARRIVQGGSTLTQQLAKNLYLSDRRTISRKLRELLITLKLSTRYDKRTILTMYLNDVYFGEGTYGIETASQRYFGHGASTLTLPQAALLAGLVNAPSYDDPLVHPGAALARRNLVLAQMAKLRYISPGQAAAAQNTPLGLSATPPPGDRAPYFTHFLRGQLAQIDPAVAANLNGGGYRIDTSMNWAMQQAAQNAVAWDAPSPSPVNGVLEPQAALVAINPQNGYVQALVGGVNYANSQLDRATRAARQPGSAMKYFLYTTVINNGYPTSTVKDSAPVRYPAGNGQWYVPHNYGYTYNGWLTMRRAIALSDNIVAVKWMDTVGPAAMIAMAHNMGITSPLADNLTTALGSSSVTPFEMASAVAPLANGGYRIKPLSVLQIKNAAGQVIYRDRPSRTRVITPQVAYVVANLFTAPLLNPLGTAHDLASILNRPADAKTGTSSGQRDSWLVGFTPQLTAAVWVGNDNGSPVGLTGDAGAGPIWANFMAMALAGQAKVTPTAPPGVVTKRVCVKTGLLDNGCCTSYREVFIQGHVPATVSPGCANGGGPGALGAPSGGQTTAPGASATAILQRILRSLAP
ncbi:MAG: PBP1A family penicillin-binding protein [Thermaerobacter sp.]|nr:PBP1A family penicillin-binding protein [Thermaerobacter sp.]